MENKIRRGALGGLLLALLIILSQPFHPTKGLIPELAAFLVTVPLWIAAMFFKHTLTPLLEGGVILIYFTVIGTLVGVAFERKAIWGWLLVVTLAIHHYAVYEQFSRQMGEVVQSILNYFG